MEFNLNKIKEIAQDYVGYLFLVIVIAALGYFGYFFYQNIYLTVTEKVPLEEIIVKERINLGLYDQVQESLKEKKVVMVNTTTWKDLFEG